MFRIQRAPFQPPPPSATSCSESRTCSKSWWVNLTIPAFSFHIGLVKSQPVDAARVNKAVAPNDVADDDADADADHDPDDDADADDDASSAPPRPLVLLVRVRFSLLCLPQEPYRLLQEQTLLKWKSATYRNRTTQLRKFWEDLQLAAQTLVSEPSR